jgi:hypothetical protein
MYLDHKMYKDRLLTTEERLVLIDRDARHAKRLGCAYLRMLMNTSPELMVASIPIAEKYDLKIIIEVHAPVHFDHPWIMRHAEAYAKTGSDRLGFLPDMGIFTKRYPRVFRDRFVRDGATPEIADFIAQAYEEKVLADYVVMDVRQMGGNPKDVAMAESTRHNVYSNPRHLLEHMDRIHHVHGKFYEMLSGGSEQSIAYDEVLPVLIEGGFSGYISSEYEGNRHIQDAFPVDSVEQVRRHQAMLARLIGETPAEAH